MQKLPKVRTCMHIKRKFKNAYKRQWCNCSGSCMHAGHYSLFYNYTNIARNITNFNHNTKSSIKLLLDKNNKIAACVLLKTISVFPWVAKKSEKFTHLHRLHNSKEIKLDLDSETIIHIKNKPPREIWIG